MLLAAAPAQANRIDVKPGTGTLQRAVDRADAGDVLRLRKGVYGGGVVIETPLTIRGPRDGGRARVDGRCRESFTILALDRATLSHLSVTGATDGAGSQYGGAEVNFIDGGRGTANDLKLRESCDGTQYGINVFDTGDVAVRDGTFVGYLDAAVYVGGIRDPETSVDVSGITTRRNNRGVLIEDSLPTPEIRVGRNDLSRNEGSMSAGVYVRNSDDVLVEGNQIAGSGFAGIWLDSNSDFNVLRQNSATGSATADLQNEGDGNCGSDNTFGTQAGPALAPC